MDRMTESASTDIPPVITELACVPPKIVPPKPKPKKESRVVLKDTYIKVIVNVKNNPYLFDLFINKLQSADPADLKIVEDTLNLEGVTEEELIAEQKDTRTALHEFVDSLENVVDPNTKTRIKGVLDSLYAEAMAL